MNYRDIFNKAVGLVEIPLANLPAYFVMSQLEMYERVFSNNYPLFTKVVHVGLALTFYGIAATGSVDGVRRMIKRDKLEEKVKE